MPSVQENLNKWSNYDWTQQGNEWSSSWGGTDNCFLELYIRELKPLFLRQKQEQQY